MKEDNTLPISITITANNAMEAKQLVQDLAYAIFRLPLEAITDAEVSTVETVETKTETAPQTTAQTVAQAAAPSPATVPTAAPAAPTAAPVAPTPNSSVPVTPTSDSTTPTTSPAAPGPAPTAIPQYDFNQLATATMQLQQAGYNIFEIFNQFGITALNQLPKERYAEYAAVLRQRGAKI